MMTMGTQMRGGMIPALLLACVGCWVGMGARAATTNTWLGKSPDWQAPANWSAGVVPSSTSVATVVVAANKKRVYPALTRDVVVGGALKIGKRARLDLAGHGLAVGRALRAGAELPGLTIEPYAALVCGDGTPIITIYAGGLVNHGRVRGRLSLHVAGDVSRFLIDGGAGLSLAELRTLPSPYPYTVQLGGRIEIEGDMTLGGGRVLIGLVEYHRDLRKFVMTRDAVCTVGGDLVFLGSHPNVMLVPMKDLLLSGTIRSEGSAFCVEAPGSVPNWDADERVALCRTGAQAGWVRMVGKGDQVIRPGGILPPIAIGKPSGHVKATADLHCNGLLIKKRNRLELSKGQRLILGHHMREHTSNPERNELPRIKPMWSSRGLINYGVLEGEQGGVPVTLLLYENGTRYAVECRYTQPSRDAATGPADMSAQLFRDFPERAPGTLAVNRLESRLQVREGSLLLDGAAPAEEMESGPGGDPDLDELFGDVLSDGGKKAGMDLQRARLSSVRLVALAPPTFTAPAAFPVNLAPFVRKIAVPSARTPLIWAVNGNEWSTSRIYDMVDGDADTGYGGAPHCDFVFPEAVAVGAVRAIVATKFTKAAQFIVLGDTTNDGVCETLLGWCADGVQGSADAWRSWGDGWTVFPSTSVFRVRFQALDREGKFVGAALNEFEIYGDNVSLARLRQQDWVKAGSAFPEDARFLSHGDEVRVDWPEPDADNRVSKVVSTAFWMFHVQGDGEKGAWSKFEHLRDYAPCVKVLDEMKNRYGFDTITLFWEAAKEFHWPSVNFRGEINAGWFDKRERARKVAEIIAPDGTEAPQDEFDQLLADVDAAEHGGGLPAMAVSVPWFDEKDLQPFSLEDLPCKRNLLAELCELAHERDMKVAVICRPEDLAAYLGTNRVDTYELFLKECAAAGVDVFSLTPDEEDLQWTASRHPDWAVWHAEWKKTAERLEPNPVIRKKRLVIERAKLAGRILKQRMSAVRAINPKAEFYTDGARLLHNGAPYDIIGHIAEPDYIGCSYQAHIVRRWAATTRGRRVEMGEYPHRHVGWPIQSVLQGARAVRSYRYNYIQMQKSEDYRVRENKFIDRFVEWGGTRPCRPPTALLVSRASEAWWPGDCKNGLTGTNAAERAWAVSEALYGFLMRNGYSFDVYYLDQSGDLEALREYRLVVVPFAYSMPKESLPRLEKAYEAGASFLVCERRGEVDELGRPHEQPILADLIERGRRNKRVRFIEEDLLPRETERDFVPWMASVVDELLGPHKELTLRSYGNTIEGMAYRIQPDEQYAALINWGRKEAQIEIGLNLPEGKYKVLTLSSDKPAAFRKGLIDGRKEFSADELKNIALKLNGGEVLALYVISADREWEER